MTSVTPLIISVTPLMTAPIAVTPLRCSTAIVCNKLTLVRVQRSQSVQKLRKNHGRYSYQIITAAKYSPGTISIGYAALNINTLCPKKHTERNKSIGLGD